MAFRRRVLDYREGAAIIWTPRHATSTFLKLCPDLVGLPPREQLELYKVRKDIVDELPLIHETLEPTDTVVFYGPYGASGQFVRWNNIGAVLPALPLDWYIPIKGINNFDGFDIGTDILHMYRRRPRKA